MRQLIAALFSSPPLQRQAYAAYGRIVEQSRLPVFYRQWQIEDTLDGRFDVVALHLFLVLSRCAGEKEHSDADAFGRLLSEAFFSDMDRSLREMGVGDTGVGKRVRAMAEAFYGRMRAYTEAMENDAALRLALRRNAYRERPVAEEAVASLAAYMRDSAQALRHQPFDEVLKGAVFLRCSLDVAQA